ncbi:MAG TPA: YfiR family protein [Vicinamibacterales bacterium]
MTSRGFDAMGATVVALMLAASSVLLGQDVPLEYRVKAAYLVNFTKFIDWPKEPGPLTICVAGRNVFGDVLSDTIRGETINGRPLAVRVLLEPEPGCHVTFVPRGAAAPAYLRAARSFPELTVGESPDFIAQGGIVNFVVEGGSVRFEIDANAAERSGLRISSRLLQLARDPGGL